MALPRDWFDIEAPSWLSNESWESALCCNKSVYSAVAEARRVKSFLFVRAAKGGGEEIALVRIPQEEKTEKWHRDIPESLVALAGSVTGCDRFSRARTLVIVLLESSFIFLHEKIFC